MSKGNVRGSVSKSLLLVGVLGFAIYLSGCSFGKEEVEDALDQSTLVSDDEQAGNVEENDEANDEANDVDSDLETEEGNDVGSDPEASIVTIEITPPEGWSPVEGSVLPVQYLNGMVSFMIKEERFSSGDLDEVVVEAQDIFSGVFDDTVFEGESESLEVGGYDARSMVFTCNVSGFSMKYQYVYVQVESATYAITFGGPVDSFDLLLTDYEQILADIAFVQ